MESEFGSLLTHEKTRTGGVGVVDLPGTVDGRQRSSKVRQDTGHTDVVSLTRNSLEREGVLDGFLGCLISRMVKNKTST